MAVSLRPHLIVPAEATRSTFLEVRPCPLPDGWRRDREACRPRAWHLRRDERCPKTHRTDLRRAGRVGRYAHGCRATPCVLALAVGSASYTVAGMPLTCRTRASMRPPSPAPMIAIASRIPTLQLIRQRRSTLTAAHRPHRSPGDCFFGDASRTVPRTWLTCIRRQTSISCLDPAIIFRDGTFFRSVRCIRQPTRCGRPAGSSFR